MRKEVDASLLGKTGAQGYRAKIPVYTDELIDYVESRCFQPSPVLESVRAQAIHEPWGFMQTSPDQAALLYMLTRLSGARRILEIGCFLGHASIAMARALPQGGRLVSLDHDPEWAQKARANFASAGVADRIELRLCKALEGLESLASETPQEKFDMAFIDADKTNALAYFQATLELVREGGLLIVDNVLWRGRIANPDEVCARSRALRELNDFATQEPSLESTIVTLADGMLLVRKKAAHE
ncbi:MAG: class I SAM-dependent methyltransferase [Silvanigrellales bacterium]|nr:class I SAM-dependent methyltransferase [Silvanigrellales bacterium]